MVYLLPRPQQRRDPEQDPLALFSQTRQSQHTGTHAGDFYTRSLSSIYHGVDFTGTTAIDELTLAIVFPKGERSRWAPLVKYLNDTAGILAPSLINIIALAVRNVGDAILDMGFKYEARLAVAKAAQAVQVMGSCVKRRRQGDLEVEYESLKELKPVEKVSMHEERWWISWIRWFFL
ncbi:uncharacterized protein CLAFUR5_08848 [Fulvia fulva]|uniref:Uncharacterized protein n=1 Tax=Passalora fulva TaxID=5499 RepID=A0A9Q8UTS7_PASFU|nr:uncharacterized protein CLAFUR5_08848 [Fulvia fulva]UJO22135.1 hypothetical protein CLAFUR5_08848 [Fulvia fulva]